MQFKFKWLDAKGQEQGFRSKAGSFDGENLVLDDVVIPAVAMMHADHRDQRMLVTAVSDEEKAVNLPFIVKKGSAAQLKQVLGIARSAHWAKSYREELEKKSLVHLYRDAQCPHCHATLILANLPETPQLYCEFCDTLTTVDNTTETPPADENRLKLCDECGMFSKPRKFTIFYFYFLVAVYGWHQRTTWRCPGCMRGDAWKMFFGNLIFILGVPVALVQLARCYGGALGGAFAGLDAANLKARKGNIQGAVAGYRPILDRVPITAGVKYNLGRALAKMGQTEQAAEAFRMSLADCANYQPSCQALAACYEQLGEQDKLTELRRQYDPLEEEDSE